MSGVRRSLRLCRWLPRAIGTRFDTGNRVGSRTETIIYESLTEVREPFGAWCRDDYFANVIPCAHLSSSLSCSITPRAAYSLRPMAAPTDHDPAVIAQTDPPSAHVATVHVQDERHLVLGPDGTIVGCIPAHKDLAVPQP